MSGYLRFEYTGIDMVDKILEALEDAGDAYHHTHDWCEKNFNYKDGEYSHIQHIQEVANDVAAKILNMQMLLDKT